MVKTYTDLEQSKRLAEILPLNSADMYFDGYGRLPQGYAYTLISPNSFEHDYPCWSLAALFDTLPKAIDSYSKMMGYFDGAYHCDYIDEDGESLGNETTADTLIDAVYEMIIKLHEQNLYN